MSGGNSPESFRDKAKQDPAFMAPMFFLGWHC